MAGFRNERPLQDVRLRNWPAGRQASMKLMISRLEDVLNDTLAAQVDQSVARVTSDEVAIIPSRFFIVDGGYRSFKISFPTPPGLKRLLFYEIEHDDNSSFTSPTRLDTPQNNIILGGIGLGETRFFRARVVNTSFEASPFTRTRSATSAKGIISITRPSDTSIRLVSDVGVFQDIVSTAFSPSGGAIMYKVNCVVNARKDNIIAPGPVVINAGPGHVQFRLLISGPDIVGEREIGDRCVISARAHDIFFDGSEIEDDRNGVACASFMTPFLRLGGSGSFTFKLQAMKLVGSEWRGKVTFDELADPNTNTYALPTPVISDPLIHANDIELMEVQERF